MIAQTIGGLFEQGARAEAALDELHQAGFLDAEISEVAATPAQERAAERAAEVESEVVQVATGTEFRDRLIAGGINAEDAAYFEFAIARGAALVTVQTTTRPAEAMDILLRHGADVANQTIPVPVEVLVGIDRDAVDDVSAIEATRLQDGTLRVARRTVIEEVAFDVAPTPKMVQDSTRLYPVSDNTSFEAPVH